MFYAQFLVHDRKFYPVCSGCSGVLTVTMGQIFDSRFVCFARSIWPKKVAAILCGFSDLVPSVLVGPCLRWSGVGPPPSFSLK